MASGDGGAREEDGDLVLVSRGIKVLAWATLDDGSGGGLGDDMLVLGIKQGDEDAVYTEAQGRKLSKGSKDRI